MISVLMSVYKEPLKYIELSTRSILNQTYKDIEFIVILDAPEASNTRTFLENLSKHDKRVRLIVNKKNIGLTKSLNKGLKIAHGEYIARMDADDISLPDRLEKQLTFLETNNLDLVGCNIRDIDSNGIKSKHKTKYPLKDKVIKKYLKYDSAIPHPTWLAKKKLFSSMQYIDFPACEDYGLLTRFALKGANLGNLKEVKLYYRINKDGISSTKRIKQKTSFYFLSKNYRKKIIPTLNEFEEFERSKKGLSKKKSLSHYYKMLHRIRETKSGISSAKKALFLCVLAATSREFYLKLYRTIHKKQLTTGASNE